MHRHQKQHTHTKFIKNGKLKSKQSHTAKAAIESVYNKKLRYGIHA